ncbi:MAG TPA: hypothetical protein VGF99_14030, partial [Myxococcota bacterium]
MTPAAHDDHWVLDFLLPASARLDSDELRRGRLFVVASIVLACASSFFAFASFQSEGFGPVSGTLGVGAVIALLNLPLSRFTQQLKLVSTLVCIEHIVVVGLCGLFGAGVADASAWWLAPAPLVATVLLGSRAGLVSATAASIWMIGLFAAEQSGFQFDKLQRDSNLFIMMAAVTVFFALAGLAWAYEDSRQRSSVLIDEAVTRLQAANEELSRVAAALTTARDQAVADGTTKSAFLDDMRRFSQAQTTALSQTTTSTQRLTTSIRAIAKSVDTLA